MRSLAYIMLITVFVFPFYFYKVYVLENTDKDIEVRYLLSQPDVLEQQFDNSINKKNIYDMDINDRDNRDLAEFDSSFKNFVQMQNNERKIVRL